MLTTFKFTLKTAQHQLLAGNQTAAIATVRQYQEQQQSQSKSQSTSSPFSLVAILAQAQFLNGQYQEAQSTLYSYHVNHILSGSNNNCQSIIIINIALDSLLLMCELEVATMTKLQHQNQNNINEKNINNLNTQKFIQDFTNLLEGFQLNLLSSGIGLHIIGDENGGDNNNHEDDDDSTKIVTPPAKSKEQKKLEKLLSLFLNKIVVHSNNNNNNNNVCGVEKQKQLLTQFQHLCRFAKFEEANLCFVDSSLSKSDNQHQPNSPIKRNGGSRRAVVTVIAPEDEDEEEDQDDEDDEIMTTAKNNNHRRPSSSNKSKSNSLSSASSSTSSTSSLGMIQNIINILKQQLSNLLFSVSGTKKSRTLSLLAVAGMILGWYIALRWRRGAGGGMKPPSLQRPLITGSTTGGRLIL